MFSYLKPLNQRMSWRLTGQFFTLPSPDQDQYKTICAAESVNIQRTVCNGGLNRVPDADVAAV